MEVNAVEVRNLSKNYSLSNSQLGRLRHLFASGKPASGKPGSDKPAPGKETSDTSVWALRDVSFTVERGEAFGIIGANGSGKSTLLQMVAGILRPTSGSVEVSGRLSALLELGSGFAPEFTGRDNVYLNGSLLGLSREEIDERFEGIERFAGIGPFIDQPIKTYSTGMVLRLAFAVAAHVDPEILIVDEALAVGDISFRQRCMRKIHDLRSHGVTILFVSHETSDVKALCERCLWLETGVVREMGQADSVVAKYLSATMHREISHTPPVLVELAPEPADFERAFHGHRYGDRRATILGGALMGASGESLGVFKAAERVFVKLRFRVNAPIESAIAGFLVRNEKGENIFASNTARENYPVPPLAPGEVHTVKFHWTAPELAAGSYSISLGIADGNLEVFQMCDYVEDAVVVRSEPGEGVGRGYFRLRCTAVIIHPESR